MQLDPLSSWQDFGTLKVYSSGLGTGDVAGITEERSGGTELGDACGAGLTSQPSVDHSAASGIELDEYSYTDTDVTQILR